MDTDLPQAQASPGGSPLPSLDYRSPQCKPGVAEPNCLLAFRLAVASLLLPPVAIAALVKAGYGMSEVDRSQRPGRGYAIGAIALSLILPCVFGLFAWRVWITRDTVDVAMCRTNLRALGDEVAKYETDHPTEIANDIEAVMRNAGVSPRDVPSCVLVPRDEEAVASGAISTTYMLLPRSYRFGQRRIPNIADVVLAVDLSTHPLRESPPRVCLLFHDGHVESLPVDEARRLIAKSIPVLMGVSPTTAPAGGRDVR